MTAEQKDKFWENIISPKNFNSLIKNRTSPFVIESVPAANEAEYITAGWTIEKRFKNKVRVKKAKPTDILFEDEVWATIAELGFLHLNKSRKFKVPYSDDLVSSQDVDVVAADNETILLILCKATDGEPKRGNFKDVIETIGGRKEGLLKNLRKFFPGAKHKVKIIFATKNYILSEPDKERLDNFGILHFDEEIVAYYKDLTKHLGLSARFQLLGNLFEGQTIPEMDNQIPAIQGRMGGHVYYSFSIEPEKLLKIGYVLHRNKANKKLMPTYQRLIKKARLKSVQSFVENHGFFPNSIIININTNGKKVRFDFSGLQSEHSISKIGLLYLPKSYRSAFIIDGQHRLYGYANSIYKSTNTIPVVAFIDLDRNEQVRLFMQINENQKAVPKNLRNTLDSDLLWNSDKITEQIKALKLQIAQDLGEELSSPLFDRVIVGENVKTSTRCITIDTIRQGLERSNFFGAFSKNAVKAEGTFYKGNNDDTYNAILPFLIGCFSFIKEQIPDEWNKGENNNGFIAINAGVENLIRIFSDIIDHLIGGNKLNPKIDKTDIVVKEVAYYLEPLTEFFKKLNNEEKSDLRRSYGTGGRVKYWRRLQKAINQSRKDFIPDGFSKYWQDEAKAFNEDSFRMIRDLETFMKNDFQQKLKDAFGNKWFKDGVPNAVHMDAVTRAAQKNLENSEEENEDFEPWDCLNIIDYRKIATYGKNWSEIFEGCYTMPGEEKIRGGKEEKTKWMQKLEKIRNQNFHSYSVKEDEYNFLSKLYKWLIERKGEDD